MKLKHYLFTLLALAFSSTAFAQQIEIPLGGNAYSSNPNGGRFSIIRDNGIRGWRNADENVTVYYRTTATGDLNIALKNFKVENTAELAFKVAGKTLKMALSQDTKEASVGPFEVKDTGYVAIEISGIQKTGSTFPSIETLILSGKAVSGENVYVKENKEGGFHFGRRGPSTHLNYVLPKDKKIEWFYNEITVDKGQDVLGTYFMANGFGEGYFGMQVNSPTERRVLFSVWSPFTTDNPKEIPADQMVKLVKKGDDVKGGEFGGEGSGGQSYKVFNWKAGNTYKFLLRVRPVENGYSEYTAYFFAPEEKNWQLIASFQRPKIQTYATRFHSFLECFNPAMGNVTKIGKYGNQWVCDVDGNWTEITKARFTHDATASKGYRKDYQGGADKNGNFYLKIDGFFNEFTKYNKPLERKANGKQPKINFDKLP